VQATNGAGVGTWAALAGMHVVARLGVEFQKGRGSMLRWAAVFFVIALVAAVFGFGGIAQSSAGIAKILFVVFLVLAGFSLLFGRRAVV
jgi:uncharacterized membrane protein YtjA (UPF0391 family)